MKVFSKVHLLMAILGFYLAALPVTAQVIKVPIRYSYTNRSVHEPWKAVENVERESIGFLLTNEIILSFDYGIDEFNAYAKRPIQELGLEESASEVYRDTQLGLRLLKVQQGDGLASPGNPKTQEKPVSFPSIVSNLSGTRKDTPLRIVGNRNRETVVFFEKFGEYTFRDTEIPVILFSGWTSDVSLGDLVMSNDDLAGIVISYDEKRKLGVALPALFVQPFWENFQNRKKSGKLIVVEEGAKTSSSDIPSAGFKASALMTRGAREYLGIGPDTGAAMVTEILPDSGAFGKLQLGDLILSVDSKDVTQNGKIKDEMYGDLSVAAGILLNGGSFKKASSKVTLKIVRNKEIRNISVTLDSFADSNIRIPNKFTNPPYAIVGGLLFTELSSDYAQKTDANSRLKYLVDYKKCRTNHSNERYVILQRVLPIDANRPYENSTDLFLLSVNGIAIRNLVELDRLITDAIQKKQVLRFIFEGNQEMMIDSTQLDRYNEAVRNRYAIPYLKYLPK